jgi:uncharacterized lipoprotein NlpE involved in copper resistance
MIKKVLLIISLVIIVLVSISCNNTETNKVTTKTISLTTKNYDNYLSMSYTTSPASSGKVVCTVTIKSTSSDYTFKDCQIFIRTDMGNWLTIPTSGNTSFSYTISENALSTVKVNKIKGSVIIPNP